MADGVINLNKELVQFPFDLLEIREDADDVFISVRVDRKEWDEWKPEAGRNY